MWNAEEQCFGCEHKRVHSDLHEFVLISIKTIGNVVLVCVDNWWTFKNEYNIIN